VVNKEMMVPLHRLFGLDSVSWALLYGYGLCDSCPWALFLNTVVLS